MTQMFSKHSNGAKQGYYWALDTRGEKAVSGNMVF